MSSSTDFSRIRFLIVDDEAYSREVLRRVVERLGVAGVEAASDGVAALERLSAADSDPVDCLITDIDMSPMSGLELLKAVRTGDAGVRRDLPVIMLTGLADRALVDLARGLDANGFAMKPVVRNALETRLASVFSRAIVVASPETYRNRPVAVGDAVAAEDPQDVDPGPGVALALADAGEGDVLARDVVGRDETVILAEGTVLTGPLLQYLSGMCRAQGVEDRIWVRK